MSSAPKLIVATLAALLCGACADKAEKPTPAAPPAAVPLDAGVVNAAPPVTFDPTAAHLDDGPSTTGDVRPTPRRATRPIEIVLRSTPNAARVFVDGEERGTTPLLWQGETGEHAFTFVKKDHAMARYRFWVITSGIVHARLEPVAEEIKVGPPAELVTPQVPAPTTLLTPDAAPLANPSLSAPLDAAPLGPSPTDAAAPPVQTDAPTGSSVGPLP